MLSVIGSIRRYRRFHTPRAVYYMQAETCASRWHLRGSQDQGGILAPVGQTDDWVKAEGGTGVFVDPIEGMVDQSKTNHATLVAIIHQLFKNHELEIGERSLKVAL